MIISFCSFRPQEVSNEEDDFFEGDFALLGKPKPSKPILDEQCGVVVVSIYLQANKSTYFAMALFITGLTVNTGFKY